MICEQLNLTLTEMANELLSSFFSMIEVDAQHTYE